MKPQGQRRGLTLIEVLIAVAILSVGMVAMLTAISRCLAVLKISEQYHKVMWALNAGDTEYPMIRYPGVEPEDFQVDGADFDGIHYERLVEDPDEDMANGEARLLVITVGLSWEGRGREQQETIYRYLVFKDN